MIILLMPEEHSGGNQEDIPEEATNEPVNRASHRNCLSPREAEGILQTTRLSLWQDGLCFRSAGSIKTVA